MINERNVKGFCCEDISQIENYDKAINDNTQTWCCHHRFETDKNLSVKELKSMKMYYHRPANELIFLTQFEHKSLHHKGKAQPWNSHKKSEETKHKLSDKLKGIPQPWNSHPHSEEHNRKIGEGVREAWKRRKEKW